MRYYTSLVLITVVLVLAACSGGEVQPLPTETDEATVPPTEADDGAEEESEDDEMTSDADPPASLARFVGSWSTDWSQHTVPYDEIISGGVPRDGIPPIYNPTFESIDSASEWLGETEPVIAVEIEGEARAYPLSILTRHEIANDELGGIPITVTFCPLCNSALVFDRRVDGSVYEFGVSGLLRNSDLIMWDNETESLWQQFTGEGIVGVHAGDQLTIVPSGLVSFTDFAETYPQGEILSRNTGIYPPSSYGTNPYAGYDTPDRRPFLMTGDIDERLQPMIRVVGVVFEDESVAYPYPDLAQVGAVNDTVGGRDIVVFHQFGTNSALGDAQISAAEDVGATGVFDPEVDGEILTFITTEDGIIVDEQTGSEWNVLGRAVAGELEGEQLAALQSTDHFWFSWAAFYPETSIWEN